MTTMIEQQPIDGQQPSTATTSSSPKGRPPKPVPFGYEYATPSNSSTLKEKSTTTDAAANTTSLNKTLTAAAAAPSTATFSAMDSSLSSHDDSRRNLRADVQKRRKSLTDREIQFLNQLCEHGKEMELQVARTRLLDEALFPEYDDSPKSQPNDVEIDADLDASEHSSSDLIQYGGERSADLMEGEATKEPDILTTPAPSERLLKYQQMSSSSLGSEKRQMLLESRKKNAVFNSLWKSHQNGLSLSKGASRRNLLERQNSINRSMRTSGGGDDIFRSRRNSASSPKSPRNDIQSDNFRRASRRPSFRRSQTLSTSVLGGGRRASASNILGGRRASASNVLGGLAGKPIMRRRQSDVSQKSVTFGDLPSERKDDDEDMDAGFLDFLKRTPQSDSLSSFPSLHKAHRVGSIGSLSMRSLSSIPSLHLANRIYSRSQSSFRSSLSTGTDWDVNEDSATEGGEEKKVDDLPEYMDIDESNDIKVLQPLSKVSSVDLSRPVLVSNAHGNDEEGMEVADFGLFASDDKERQQSGPLSVDSARRLGSLVSFGAGSECIVPSASFDETMSHGRVSAIFRRSNLLRTLSDDDMSGVYLGGSRLYRHESSSVKEVQPTDDDVSWIGSDDDEFDHYDAWNVIKDDYANGYGGGGTLPFLILGTFADDIDSQPHVLSPPLMESLQEFLPFEMMGENFWMKYSLVRDGASMIALLKAARGTKYSILAIETVDGEVFGCFTSQAWRKNWNYYGGSESFLWRMQHTRKEKTRSVIDQAQMESDIEVYPYTGANDHIQLCTTRKIAVGGRSEQDAKEAEEDRLHPSLKNVKDYEWGFGLTIEKDCLTGTTSPCMTFSSPSLSHEHSDGSLFEIMNMELWTLTPCATVEDAERLELAKLFLEEHTPR
ncbi:hypothetical protein MPSEU_001017000 [Mayamaea pseudoterrestris]|nr:hypothetical protein MPSEU_001017000 [Mayamaea pseudoterrestris]